jgi:hypothetical protein
MRQRPLKAALKTRLPQLTQDTAVSPAGFLPPDDRRNQEHRGSVEMPSEFQQRTAEPGSRD